MRATRRAREIAALGLALAGLAVLFERPLLLAGAAGVGAWLLARQYAFLRALDATLDGLAVEQTVSRSSVATDEALPVTLRASRDDSTELALTIEATPPVAATGATASERTIRLDDEHAATTTLTVEWPVAGAFTVPAPTVTATDGLFEETLERGATPEVTVEPRAPRNMHVGQGGEEVAAAFGEHEAGRLGAGLDPAEIREYVPGDAANRIDWKATARLDHPHVREYEAETDRTTALLVDHRNAMGTGPEGETKLDYLRQVALAFVDSARELDDPLGCYAVGDGGLTEARPPEATPDTYATIRRRLHDLTPTARTTSTAATTTGPARARRAASRLDGDTSAFGTTLRPYFASRERYVARIEDEPLFATVRTHLGRLRGTLWTVVLTDDTNRADLREAVRLARRGDDHVLVFVAPSVLFEPGGLADVDAAYERYADFEEFRRDLARLDRVSAFEVAPGDRLDAVLAARRERRRHSARRGV